MTVKMSASLYSTVYLVIPLFNIILDHVEDVATSRGNGPDRVMTRIRSAAQAAREKLVQYYSKTNTTIMLCTALDPRRKFYYFVKRDFPKDEIHEAKAL